MLEYILEVIMKEGYILTLNVQRMVGGLMHVREMFDGDWLGWREFAEFGEHAK